MGSVVSPARMSHVRDTRPNPADRAPNPTRTLATDRPDRSFSPPPSSLPGLSAPASQESIASAHSSGAGGSGSDMSQLTAYTDLTTPSYSQMGPVPDAATYESDPRRLQRTRTPDWPGQRRDADDEAPLFSPMSLASPVPTTTTGAKRTAGGHIKNAPSLPNTPMTAVFNGHRPRQPSVSSTGSRAGELAASLKTRLGYAMAKVQHGWERKSLIEVEQLAADTAPSTRYSMSHLDGPRANGTAVPLSWEDYGRGMLAGTASPPSKRRSGTVSSWQPSALPATHPRPGPHLEPPADIRPSAHSRHAHHASSTSQPRHYGEGITTPPPLQQQQPHTPTTRPHHPPRRPQAIRTDTQTAEAERDALQALFQLGSPHTSQVSRLHPASQESSSQASPLRSEFATPRKAMLARSESDSSAAPSLPDQAVLDPRRATAVEQ